MCGTDVGVKMMPLKITNFALDKAVRYAHISYKSQKSECYGWLLTPRASKDFVVRDVSFADDQSAHHTGVNVSGAGVITSIQEATNQGYRVIGWWHSHANFEPFQSPIDNENTRDVLNVVSLTNFLETNKEKDIFEGDLDTRITGEGVILKSRNRKESLLLEVSGNFSIDPGSRITRVKLIVPQRIGFCYSLTVNKDGDKPSALIGLKYSDNGEEEKLLDTTLEVLDTDKLMELEVKKKMK